MYPILFPYDNITTRLGMGKMIETISCEVYEEINGEFSLEFEYPITGELYADLLNGGTVQVISPTYVATNVDRQGMQWFDIYKHSLPINGVVTFYAQHISRRLSQGVFVGTSAGGTNLAYIWGTDCKPSNPFNGVTFAAASGTNPGTGNTFTVSEPKSPLGVLLGSDDSFVSNFGGEVGFKCDFSVGNPRCTVYYVTQRGGDYGAEVRHGYNLTDLQREKDASECYNAVVPYWDDGSGNKTYTLNYVVQPTTPITPVVAVPLDATDAFPTQPTDAQLTTFAQNHLDNYTPWVIPETLTVDFINGVEVDPHAAPIGIGDIVHVYWADGSVDAKMRVISYKYDVLAERYAELTLGSPQREFVAVTGESIGGNTISGGGGGGGLPAGGNQGQVLTKNSNADGDATWKWVFNEYTSGDWTVREYGDGSVECWCDNTQSHAMTAAMDSLYHSVNKSATLPSGLFASAPSCMANLLAGGFTVSVQITGRSTTAITFGVVCTRSLTANVGVHFHCWGTKA